MATPKPVTAPTRSSKARGLPDIKSASNKKKPSPKLPPKGGAKKGKSKPKIA